MITSGAAPVETVSSRINRPVLEPTLSRHVVETVTEPNARHVTELLGDAGPHGHEYAVDVMLNATSALGKRGQGGQAAGAPDDHRGWQRPCRLGPVTILTLPSALVSETVLKGR
ncbi:DNA-binding protein [Streptomyces chartreusis]|uniref:DNA-binding protein n=1 Tax=Streptomyces chartreusis TaxID=1969 RepID=UPI003F54136D